MAPRRRLLYNCECRESFLSPIHQTPEWAHSPSLFDPEFLDPITDHAPSPPDYIRHVCKGWCHLDDRAHRNNLVRDTLLPSIKEGETLKDSTTSDFRSLIQKIRLGKAEWVGRFYRGYSSFSIGGSRWEAFTEHCLNNYCTKVDVVGMAEALHGSINSFDKHNAMVTKPILRWCPDTNTFLGQYDELGISLSEFIGVSHLHFEGRLMEEYIPFNAHFKTLSTTCRRLFQIFFEFNNVSVSYGSWLGCICQGPSGMTARGRPLPWTKNNIRWSIDLDGLAFLAEVYIAFLSGWALPSSMGERICPSVFIDAANLADGICMNLAVPSLCCLYKGLRDIVEASLQKG